MHFVSEIERAITDMLTAALPPRLEGTVGVPDAREWVLEHLECYGEEKARFPDQSLVPWPNLIGYDDDWDNAFFVIVLLQADEIELFCGAGYWPDIREFGEGEAEDIPAPDLYREWASRFRVPSPPVRLHRAAVNAWLGWDW